MQDFKNIQAWQKPHELALLTYQLTHDFPRDEVFGLRNSLRRTCVDIPALVAEGAGKPNDAEFARCIGNALGLVNRFEYFALLALDLQLINEAAHHQLNDATVEVRKILSGFRRKLS